MKYIPGSADIVKKPRKASKNTNVYKICVECDANDGDYIKDTLYLDELSELEILMISYLKMERYDIPNNWEDAKEGYKKNCNYPFGGVYVGENDRFDVCYNDDDNWGTWLENYASNKDLLLFASMCDCSCHSIKSIDVTWYDENGNTYSCEFPKLGELFDSESEFINYIASISNGDEDDEF